MYEMTAAELDSELAVELPERALMARVRVNIWANQQNFLIQKAETENNTATASGAGSTAAAGNVSNFAIQANVIAVVFK